MLHAQDNRTEIKWRIGGPEHDQLTQSGSLRRRYCDARLEMIAGGEGHRAIARKAFDRALGRELEAVILETKSKAAKIQEPSGLWKLERYLTQRRQEIDRKYDYRYSVLPLVLANLLTGGRVSENELHGLGEDKLDYIHRAAVHLLKPSPGWPFVNTEG